MPAHIEWNGKLTAEDAGDLPTQTEKVRPARSQPTTSVSGLGRLAIGAALACAVFSGWTALKIGGTTGTRIFDDLVLFGSAAGAGATCVPAAMRLRGRQRAAWALVALSCFSWAAGQLVWSYYQLVAGTAVPFPGPPDIGYAAAIPLAAAGALVLYRTRGGIASQARVAVDGLIIAAGSLFVGWAAVLEEVVSAWSGGSLAQALSVYYPAGYIVVVALVLFVFAKTTERGPAITLLGWGMGVNAMASGLYGILTLNGHYYTGHVMDVTWLMSFLLVALGGRCAAKQGASLAVTANDAPTRAGAILPYLPVAVAVVVAVSRLARGQALGVFLDATGAAIVVLVVVRQLFTLMENAALARGLEEKVTERTAEVASVFKDLIEERRAREADLFRSARHDALTGLPNRTALDEHLNAALSVAGNDDRARVVVLFLDLDRFKHINDAYGHAAGDRVLVALGKRLRESMPEVFLSRFGGDEYVMVATGPFDNDTAYLLAQEVAETLRLPVDLDGSDLHLTGSVGIAVSQPGDTAEDLIRNADTAMYRSKETGTDGYAVFDQPMREWAMRRASTERDLHQAIETGEFWLGYQPKVFLTGGSQAGFEALARWNHPTRGLVPPAEFIPIAEDSGLISVIGTWALEQACAQAVAWRQLNQGLAVPVAVNLSARQLADPKLPDLIAKTLEAAGARAGDLVLEVTESAVLYDTEGVSKRLRRLRDAGVRIAIDDFGTGYSSLSYLQQLPIDELKIDRAFVSQLPFEHSSTAIIGSVIDLAHAIGLTVVAEGVETLEQLDALRELGCDVAQGYYIARPEPAAVATRRLRTHLDATNTHTPKIATSSTGATTSSWA